MHIQALSHSISKKHSDKIDWSEKNVNFLALIGWHGNVPWKIKKAQKDEQALTPVYQSWNFWWRLVH